MERSRKRLGLEATAALLWCVLTLATDQLFFRYDWKTPYFFVYKALFVLLAFAVVHGAVTLVRKVRQKDAFALRWLQWMLPYLVLTLVVLVIVWPGCWGSDDLEVLQLARTLEPSSWQHFLTSAAFILCLMFIPLPGGVVLIQTLLIAGVVGCFLAVAETLARERMPKPPARGWFAILYIPFLLPPVILHDMQPFRSTWSTWTELFTVFLLVWWYLRGQAITKKQLAVFTLLGVLTAAWRSENIYYLAALPVLLAFLVGKKLVRPAVAVVSMVGMVVGTLACSAYNNSLLGDAWLYQRVALCYQTAALVQDADQEEDAEALAMIDPIFDVQACRELSTLHGPELRNAITRNADGLTQADWETCKKGIVRLALKYPGSLLRERLGVFLNTVEQHRTESNQKLVFAVTVLVYTDPPESMREIQKDFLYTSIGPYPLNQQLREDFIMSLSYRTEFLGGVLAVTWLMLPSFALLAAAILVLLVRRKWMLFFAAGALAARIPLVFLTAPDTYFMYYLTPYMAGYMLAAAGLLYAVLLYKKKKQERGIAS
ncbi:MAG TPA: hypothetical protein H9810_11965 [Candidatus Gemmiger excrementavium]|uniref:Uncharacterized protein n=1 Tax=Candidatus Gemmiger excrementavium TaxID=2838608 RepID=A0A9D2F598_9FIRM|nr:hypothetical protein [Candidatus Gemmiger excrementavium]